jgi:phage virion morphogenesis protein
MISGRIDDREVQVGLDKLLSNGTNMLPAMRSIGEVLLSSIEENFLQEGRYSDPDSWRGGSKSWRDLAPATVEQRRKKGRGAHPILQVGGDLAASFSSDPTDDSVTVGSNKVQAHILHHGGKAGRNHKVTIPARPIIAISDDEVEEIKATIGDHLMRGVGA